MHRRRTIRPMTPADVAIDGRRDPARRLGRPAGQDASSSPSHPQCRPLSSPRRDGADRRAPASAPSTGRSAWIGTIWVDPALAGPRPRAGPHPGDHRRPRGGRLPDARARRDRGGPAALRAARASRSRRATGSSRRPGWTPAAGRPTRGVRAVPARPTSTRPWPPSTSPRPARTARTCSALRRAGDDALPAGADGGLGGFVVRAPWGGGATIAPDPDDAMAILDARRLRGGAGQARPGRPARRRTRPASTPARRPAGSTPGGAPRMIRGEMPDWHPDAIWGQFDHADRLTPAPNEVLRPR